MGVLRQATEVLSVRWLTSGALAALGFQATKIGTTFIRSNYFDPDSAFADAAFDLAWAAGTHVFGSTLGIAWVTRPVSFGMLVAFALDAKSAVAN